MSQPEKLASLDNGFLFAIGLVTFIISLIQISMQNPTQIIEAVPFFVLGILLPFIVGYFRGAIEFNSVEERMRGWIYFLIGIASYFAFFATFEIKAAYIITESLFISIIFCGAIISYLLIKWSNRIFQVHSPSIQYAYSGTALAALVCSWLLRLSIGLYYDLQGKDVYSVITTNPESLFFWISILLLSFSIVLLCEKASVNANRNQLALPTFTRIRKLFFIKTVIKAVILGFMLFEYAFDYNLKARLLWILSFVFWSFGSIMLGARIPFLPLMFFVLMMIPWVIAAVLYYRTPMHNFKEIEKRVPNKTWYLILVFLIVVLMALGGDFLTLFVAIVLTTILYIIRYAAPAS